MGNHMKKVIISKQDVEEMIIHAKEKLPNEACGLIAGSEQLQAVKDMRARGLTPLGNWHSHPESPSRPSQEDKKLAYDSKASYLILSLMTDEPVLNSFHVENGEAEKESLEIRD